MSVAPTPLPCRPATHRPPALVFGVVIAFLAITAALMILAHERTFGSGTSSPRPIAGSGVAEAQVRPLPPFTRVTAAGDTDVLLRTGTPQKVVVRADDNLVSHITTDVHGGNLAIRTHGSFTTVVPMLVTITAPSVDALTLSGNANLSAIGIAGSSLDVVLSGSGKLEAGGEAQRLDATLDGTGLLDVSKVVSTTATATLSGTGKIAVTATKSLDASISGTGQILYGGAPEHVTQNVTGAGAVTPR